MDLMTAMKMLYGFDSKPDPYAASNYNKELGGQSYQAPISQAVAMNPAMPTPSQSGFPPLEQGSVTSAPFIPTVEAGGPNNDLSSLRSSMLGLGDTPDPVSKDPFDWRRVLASDKPKTVGAPIAMQAPQGQQLGQAPSGNMRALEAIPAKYLIPLMSMMKGRQA